mgnify:FL=1
MDCATVVAMTSGDPRAPRRAVWLSRHMVQHRVFVMVAPMLLVTAAPITLALRSLPTAGGSAASGLTHSRTCLPNRYPLGVW